MVTSDFIKKIPKIELHCHLDGSVSERVLKNEMKETTGIHAPFPCEDLKEYLQCFDRILPFLQTEEALEAAARDVIRQAAEEHVIYTEIRFSPGLHCKNGLSYKQVCKAVLKGLEKGEKEFGVKSRAILCLMRGKNDAYNERILDTAKEFLGYGIGGIDLAGNEAAYPPKLYQSFFKKAYDLGIPFTIHAGECQSAENVRDAIEMGAKRIGHGVAIAENEEVKALCRKFGICLEMCPISNLQTGAVKEMDKYPFWRLHEEGVVSTVHTDNRTVSNTNLTKEWSVLTQHFPQIDEAVIVKANIAAAQATFLPNGEKNRLVKELSRTPECL